MQTFVTLGDLSLTQFDFRSILIYSLIGLAVLVVLGGVAVNASKKTVAPAKSRSWFSKLLYLAFLVTVIVLAGSSFGSILQAGHMSGYALIAHVAAAGAFTFLLLAVAVLFVPNGANPEEAGFTSDGRWWFSRLSAWLLLLSSIAAAGTMFVSMLPVLDTPGLLEFAALHRFAGLGVVISAVMHVFAMLCAKSGLR